MSFKDLICHFPHPKLKTHHAQTGSGGSPHHILSDTFLPVVWGTGWGGTGPVGKASRRPAPPCVPWTSGCCSPRWWRHRSAGGTSAGSCASASCPRDRATGSRASPSRLRRHEEKICCDELKSQGDLTHPTISITAIPAACWDTCWYLQPEIPQLSVQFHSWMWTVGPNAWRMENVYKPVFFGEGGVF